MFEDEERLFEPRDETYRVQTLELSLRDGPNQSVLVFIFFFLWIFEKHLSKIFVLPKKFFFPKFFFPLCLSLPLPPSLSFALLRSLLLSFALLCSPLLSFALFHSPSLTFALFRSASLSFALFRSPSLSFTLLRSFLLSFALFRGDYENVSPALTPTKMSHIEFVSSNLSTTKMSWYFYSLHSFPTKKFFCSLFAVRCR